MQQQQTSTLKAGFGFSWNAGNSFDRAAADMPCRRDLTVAPRNASNCYVWIDRAGQQLRVETPKRAVEG